MLECSGEGEELCYCTLLYINGRLSLGVLEGGLINSGDVFPLSMCKFFTSCGVYCKQ